MQFPSGLRLRTTMTNQTTNSNSLLRHQKTIIKAPYNSGAFLIYFIKSFHKPNQLFIVLRLKL